jgi:hypothetical protein
MLLIGSTLLIWNTANAQVDYGYMYSPRLPNEQSVEGLPYAIPCANAKNQYGAEFFRCTWYTLPRNVTQWNAQQQRNVTFSNQVSGVCRKSKCFAANESGVYGFYNRDISFSLSIYYYIYESTDGYPIAYLMNGGPNKNGNAVTYAQAKSILQNFLLERGLIESTVEDLLSKYDLDNQSSGNIPDDEEMETSSQPLTQPTRNVRVTKAWCNPRADDDCTVNDQKVPKASLKEYLPEIYELEILNAGGYCEHPICYDKDDKPVGIH